MAPRGQSARQASGARVGTWVGSGARLRLRDSSPWGLLSLLFLAVFPVLAVSALIPQQVGVHRLKRSVLVPLEGLCPPGFHMSGSGRNCTQCQSGVEYTSHSNALSSCLRCTVCNSDEDEISPCIRTRDTQCQCKPGTFHGKDDLEFCQKCKTWCPDGMVEASPCTAWGDLVCVHQSTGVLSIVIGPLVAVFLLVCVVGILWKIGAIPDCGKLYKCMARVMMRSWHVPREPEADENVYNQMLSPSLSILNLEQETQGQEQAELRGAAAPEPVLEQVKAQESHTRRRELVPADGTDPIETLKEFFNCHSDLIPFNSWTRVMRLLGLTDHEIDVARDSARSAEDECYQMGAKWLSKKGRDASVNSLLDALETLGERNAKERIEDHFVSSGKYTYKEYMADNLGCLHGNEMIASEIKASLVDFAA
ncbi:tumor necrosis factor receptor superfamily member 10A-like isoform X2 [Tamandua tetradactyla]|uniref:tumor necrosis factor receptor superfamily member 10A-like isoform X2 n=1 Tax=Tamandua tetradactyla TaxID=48850 RepID=UPI0040547CD5